MECLTNQVTELTKEVSKQKEVNKQQAHKMEAIKKNTEEKRLRRERKAMLNKIKLENEKTENILKEQVQSMSDKFKESIKDLSTTKCLTKMENIVAN